MLLLFLQRHATCKRCKQAHVLLQGMPLRIVLQGNASALSAKKFLF
jgi:hypothetical protein